MIASCHRRSGNYQNALETYKQIHRRFPENVECEYSLNLYCMFGLTETDLKVTSLYEETFSMIDSCYLIIYHVLLQV